MAGKAGALLWRRMRITLPAQLGVFDVDTGLKLPEDARAFKGNGDDEPRFDSDGLIGSRIQVLPMMPIASWEPANADVGVRHDEPYLDATTDTIHVPFIPAHTVGEGAVGISTEINVLILNPHSLIGPGQADLYVAPDD